MQLLVDNVGPALTVAADSAHAVVAEWLRRLTRNQIPSGSVGSNPTNRGVRFLFFIVISFLVKFSLHRVTVGNVPIIPSYNE